MDEPVTPRQDVDERTELRDINHAARVGSAKFRRWWVDDVQDASLGVFNLGCVRRTDGHDAHRTVVVNCNDSTCLLLDGVDDFALRPNHFTDLVQRNGDRHDLRCTFGNRLAWCSDCRCHHIENLESCIFGLLQGCCQHVAWNAIDLGVQLQRCHCICSAGHFEVHVAECILCTENVGESGVFATFIDETHRNARNRSHDWHACVHQGQARSTH